MSVDQNRNINMSDFTLIFTDKLHFSKSITQMKERGVVTLGLSAGGPLSSTEVASSGLKSKPKERGGWDLCFGASCSTDHCDETKQLIWSTASNHWHKYKQL